MSELSTKRKSNQDLAHSSPLTLRIGFWLCTLIAIAVVVRRVLALAYPPRSTPAAMAGLDEVFASHATLTLAHILPALAFVSIAPFVVFRRSLMVSWGEQVIYPLGLLVGLTAYAMSAFSIGGWTERSAVLVFDTLFLFSLFRAWQFRRHGAAIQSRRWILRAIVVLLGIASTRPVMGIFFATAPRTHLTPNQFFGIAFWIGFSINAIVIELWLRSKYWKARCASNA
jgi:hypothetical protein